MPFAFASKLSYLPRRAYRTVRYKVTDVTSRPEPRPVFFLGNPKSGTTAISALFARATGRSFSSDMCFRRRWFDAGAMLRSDLTIAELRRRGPAEFANGVIKDPFFSFAAPELRRLYPNSPIFFIVRNPYDNIRSILNRLNIPGNLEALEPTHYAKLAKLPLWRCFFDPIVMGSGRTHYVELLAQVWQKCVENAEVVLPTGCHLIYYENFVCDKKRFLEETIRLAGLEISEDITPYMDMQFQPKGDRSIGIASFFGDNLHRVDAVCSLGMARHGYTPVV